MRLAVATLVLMTGSVVQANEYGKILIFSDAAFTDSTLVDNGPRIANIYIVHADFSDATGVSFRTEASAGFTGVWLGETSPWSPYFVGTTPTGASVSYAKCVLEDVLLFTVTYQLFGTSSPCSDLHVAARPISSDCHFFDWYSDTGGLHVNCPVAVEQTTWGRVKALYAGR